MRLIDADALEKDYRSQFESVYKHTRDNVMPSDFYIERKAAYDKTLVKMEMEAFFEYLQARPSIDAVEVVRCKDCIKRDQSFRCIALYYGFNPHDDWFCAEGERDKNAEVNGDD